MTSTGMKPSAPSPPEPPRLENGKSLLVAGLRGNFSGPAGIPELWQRFAAYIGKIPGQVGDLGYGLSSNLVSEPFRFDYTAAVEVSDASALPEGFVHVNIPAMRYAIFSHRDHISKLRDTIDAIYHNWLPNSGQTLANVAPDLPYMLERYGDKFDPQTGLGGIEVWIPIKA
jgi:AraC family transcriptional regulator